MSRGKYSPTLHRLGNKGPYTFNCYGQEPAPWSTDYDEKTMFGNYDREGFDSYGYSSFDAEGNYVGIGNGVDRNGYTEMEYLSMSLEEFLDL